MITRHTPYLLLLPHIYRLGTRAPSPSRSSGPPRCWAPPPNKVLVPCPHPQRNSQSDGGGSCLIRKLWPGLIRPTRRERHGNRTNHNRASREGSLEEGRLPLPRPHSRSGTVAVRSPGSPQLLCVARGKRIPPVCRALPRSICTGAGLPVPGCSAPSLACGQRPPPPASCSPERPSSRPDSLSSPDHRAPRSTLSLLQSVPLGGAPQWRRDRGLCPPGPGTQGRLGARAAA